MDQFAWDDITEEIITKTGNQESSDIVYEVMDYLYLNGYWIDGNKELLKLLIKYFKVDNEKCITVAQKAYIKHHKDALKKEIKKLIKKY